MKMNCGKCGKCGTPLKKICFVLVLSSPDMLIVFNFTRCHQRRYVDVLVVHVVVHVVVVVVVVVHVADVSLEIADKSPHK